MASGSNSNEIVGLASKTRAGARPSPSRERDVPVNIKHTNAEMTIEPLTSPTKSTRVGQNRPGGSCCIGCGIKLYQGIRAFSKCTGMSLFDPLEPIIALCFVYFVVSWVVIALKGDPGPGFTDYFAPIVAGATWWRIHMLGSLAFQIDRFKAENDKFKQQNDRLTESVDGLRRQNEQFTATNERLSASVDGLQAVQAAMQEYAAKTGEDMSQLLASIKASVAEQKKIQQSTQEIQKATMATTRAQEKTLLISAILQLQSMDGSAGLSRQEFEMVLTTLPSGAGMWLKQLLTNSTADAEFSKLDADGSGAVTIAEVNSWLQQINNKTDAELEAMERAAAPQGPSDTPLGDYRPPADDSDQI